MDASQTDRPSFFCLPPDVLLSIVEHLELPDILSLRMCCSTLLEISKERSIWLRVVQEQSCTLPLPSELRHRDTLESLDTDELSRLALRAYWTERRWERPRTRLLERVTRTAPDASKPTILLGMQVLLDRWLVLVYGEGVIQVHDLLDQENMQPVAEIEWERAKGSQWSSYAMTVDTADDKEELILAVARSVPPYLLTVFTLNLGDCVKGKAEFVLLKQLSVESPRIVHAVDPQRGLLAMSTASKVQLVDLSSSKANAGNEGVHIEASQDDLWNGINAVRFMGPYLLVARTRCIELHHIPTALQIENGILSLRHAFNMTTFKEFSLSDPIATSDQVLKIIMLAYDVIQGVFRYKVEVTLPEASETPGVLPILTVTQVGLYPLGLPVPMSSTPDSTSTYPSTPRSSSPPSRTDSPTVNYVSQSTFAQNIGHLAHGTSIRSSRGFLSSFCMGPQGLRAIMVERRRGGICREVQVWSRSRSYSAAPLPAWADLFGAECEEMEKKVVYSVSSYDLRDDIICCAFSESRGIIALGNRLGNVRILPIE